MVMGEKDIKAILWLLKEIKNNKIIKGYFELNLNLHNTDIMKLINIYEDIIRILENPMFIVGDDVDIPIQPNVMIRK